MSNDQLMAIITQMQTVLDKLAADVAKLTAGTQTAASGGEVATDAELSSQWGDPTVRYDYKSWTGESQVGKTFSQCPAEYLDGLASFLDWRAGREDKESKVDNKGRPKSHWSRKDASRARGWANRIRSGYSPSASSDPSDLPF